MFYGAGLFISIFFTPCLARSFSYLFSFYTFLDGIGNGSVKMRVNVCRLKRLLDSFEQNRH